MCRCGADRAAPQGGGPQIEPDESGQPAVAPTGDYAVRAVAADERILVLAADTSRLCEVARRRHDLWPTAAAAVGRTLTATALLAIPLKPGGSITVTIKGGGPIGGVVAAALPEGEVRGYAHFPHADLPPRPDGKLDVGGVVGHDGWIRVARDLGVGRPYTGSAPLVSGEIGEDFTHYLLRSEQVPSLVALGVLVGRGGKVRSAGGLIVQMLPGAPDEEAARIEANVADLGAISRAVESGRTPEEIVEIGLRGLSPRVIGSTPLRFRCRCGRRRLSGVLTGLPSSQLRLMREEDGQAELVCHFCGKRYRFTAAELHAFEDRSRAAGR